MPACALTVVAALYAMDRQALPARQAPADVAPLVARALPGTAAGAAAPAAAAPAAVPATAPVQPVASTQQPARAQPTAADDASRMRLTPEQHNIARFVASHYRIAVDAAQQFVFEAYSAGRAARVDPHLVLAVMSVESSFNPMAQSHQGAKGLMQVLARVHQDKFEPFGGPKAVFDPMANIRVGTSILKEYLNRAGSVPGALKWYVGAALMPDDGGYGAKVLFERERIAAAAAGRPVPTEARRVAVAAPRPAAVPARWAERPAEAAPEADRRSDDTVEPASAPAHLPATPVALRDAPAAQAEHEGI